MPLIYLVNRLEMKDEVNGLEIIAEKAFTSDAAANEYCKVLDPTGSGFMYICPCGCGIQHYRSWSIETLVLEE